MTASSFNPACTQCPRLATFLAEVRDAYPSYHGRPVAPFGVADAELLIVGLAPGMHGANATGRPFTGDYAGILLYETLYKFGYSNQAVATARDDGLVLRRCRITNAVKCLPPENKPTTAEIRQCNGYLQHELAGLKEGRVILALGLIAHQAVLEALALKKRDFVFKHNMMHALPKGQWLVDSYHCSRYNTQTKRLTTTMFEEVFHNIGSLLG
ncbi:MAG: hypothetical protein FD130_1204 [Halothiobacillaceae bacterium]|nr:MAG: hypothetical protein FD130_1204 [Halothiobacillaceae bacterium]